MRKIGFAKIGAFDLSTHGQFFWNFRTELEDRWDFQRVSFKILSSVLKTFEILSSQAVANGWLPSKDDWENHLDLIFQEIGNTCNLTATDIVPHPDTSRQWSSGLIIVTVISVLLIGLLICVVATFFCKVAERSDSCWFTLQAYLLGYSPIRTTESSDFPSALEMNRSTR
jgi:hypothetical protein